MLAQRPLSDPQADLERVPSEGPFMAEMRRSRTAGVDPNRPFKFPDPNVSFRIRNQSHVSGDGIFRL